MEISIINTNQLMWHEHRKVLTADASELGYKPGFIPTSLVVESAWTRRLVKFELDYIEENGSLRFIPVSSLDKSSVKELIIFND